MSTRFTFGKNWKNFLSTLNEEKIQHAENSLKQMLNIDVLTGKRFLDAGCGSGLFSLAALRLGAKEVVSFDIDEESVACAKYLFEHYGPFPHWHIITGSALDTDFLCNIGKFDIVYSWGVLHHTGNMCKALDSITIPVKKNGYLFVSIYNNQGIISTIWKGIKWFYNVSPKPIKLIMEIGYYFIVLLVKTFQGITQWQPLSQWYAYGNERGMSLWHDVVDRIGGYPFETATPQQIVSFYEERQFQLTNSNEKSGSGCNEFVFHSTIHN